MDSNEDISTQDTSLFDGPKSTDIQILEENIDNKIQQLYKANSILMKDLLI